MDQQKQNNMLDHQVQVQDNQQHYQQTQKEANKEQLDQYLFGQIYGNQDIQHIQSKSSGLSQNQQQTNQHKTQNKQQQQKYNNSNSPFITNLNKFDIKIRKKYLQYFIKNGLKKSRKSKDKDKDNKNKSLVASYQKRYYYFQILDEQTQNQTGKVDERGGEKQDDNTKNKYQQKKKKLYKNFRAKEKFEKKMQQINQLAKGIGFDRARRNKFNQSKNIPNINANANNNQSTTSPFTSSSNPNPGVNLASEPQKYFVKNKKLVNSLNTNSANKNSNRNGNNNKYDDKSNIDLKLHNDGKYNYHQKQLQIQNGNQLGRENQMEDQNAQNLVKIMDFDKPGLYSISVSIGLLEISINVFVLPMELTGIQRQISIQKNQNTRNRKKIGNFYQKQSQIYGKSYHFIPYFKPHQGILLIRAAIQKYIKSLMIYNNQLSTPSSSSSSSSCLDLILDPLNQCAFIPSLCFDKEFIIDSVANGRKYYQKGILQFRKTAENIIKLLGKNGASLCIFDQICYCYVLDRQQDNLNKQNEQKQIANKKIEWKNQNFCLFITLAISKYHYLAYQTDFQQNVCNPYGYYLQTNINSGENNKDGKFQYSILQPKQGCEAVSSSNFFGCEAKYQSSDFKEKSDQQRVRKQEKQYFQNLEGIFQILQRFVLKKEYHAVFELFINSSQNKTKQPIFKNNKQLLIFVLNHLHKNLQFLQYKQYLQKLLKLTQQTQQNPPNFVRKKSNQKSLLSPTLRKNRKQLYLERRRSRSYSQSSKNFSSPSKHHQKHEHGYKKQKLHMNSKKNENKDNNNQIQAYHRQYHQQYEYRYGSQLNSKSSDEQQQENSSNKFVKNFNFNLKSMNKNKLFPFKNFCIQEKNRSQEDQEYKRKARNDKKEEKRKADSSSSSEWSKDRVQDRIQDFDDLENQKEQKNKEVKTKLPNKNNLKQQQQSNPLGKQYAYLFLPYQNKNINKKKECQPTRSQKPQPEKQQQLKKVEQQQIRIQKNSRQKKEQEKEQEKEYEKEQENNQEKLKKYLQLNWSLQFFMPKNLHHEKYKMFVQMKKLSSLSEDQWKHIWNMFQEGQSIQYKMQEKQQLNLQNPFIMFQQLIPKIASYLLIENLNPIFKLIKFWQQTFPIFSSQQSYFLSLSYPSTITDLPPQTVLLQSFLTNIISLNLKSLSISLISAIQQNCLQLCSIIFEQLSTIILLLYRFRLDRVTCNGLCLAQVIYDEILKIGNQLGQYVEKKIQSNRQEGKENFDNLGVILKTYERQSQNIDKIAYATNYFIKSKSFLTMFPLYCNYILYLNQIQQLNRIINSFSLKNTKTSSDKYTQQYNKRINQKINTSPSQLQKIFNLYKKSNILNLLFNSIKIVIDQLSLSPPSQPYQFSFLQLSSSQSSVVSPVLKHKIFFNSCMAIDMSDWLLTMINSIVIFQSINTQHLLYAFQQYQTYTQFIYQQLSQMYTHLTAVISLFSQCYTVQQSYLQLKQANSSAVRKPQSQTTTSPVVSKPPIIQPSKLNRMLNIQQATITMLTNSVDKYRYIVSWYVNWYMVDGIRVVEGRGRAIEQRTKATTQIVFGKLFKFCVIGRKSCYWVGGFEENGLRGFWEWVRCIRVLELPQSITYNLKYQKSLSSQNPSQPHKILQNFQHLLDSLSPNSCLNSSQKSFSNEHLLVLLPKLLQKCFGSHQQAHLYTEYRDQIEHILMSELKSVIYEKEGVEESGDLYGIFGNFCTNVIVNSLQYANKFRKYQEFLQIVQDYIYKARELGQYIYQKCKKDYKQNLKQSAQLSQQNKVIETFKQIFKKVEKQLNSLQQKNKGYILLTLQDIGKAITCCSDQNLYPFPSQSQYPSASCTPTHIFLHSYLQLSKIATHIIKIISAIYSLSHQSTNNYILLILQSCQKFLNYLPEELPNIQIQLLKLRYFCEKIRMIGKGEIGSISGNWDDIGKFETMKNLYLKNREHKYFGGFLMYLQIQAKKTSKNKQVDKMQQFQAPSTHRQQQQPAHLPQWITLFEQQYTITQILQDQRKQTYLTYLIQYLPSNYYKRLIDINILLPDSKQVLKQKQKQKQEQKQKQKQKQEQKQRQKQKQKQEQKQKQALPQKNSAQISTQMNVEKYKNSVLYLAIQYLWKFKVQENNYVPIWSLIRIVSLQLYKIMKVRPTTYYRKIHQQQLLSKLHYSLAKFYKIFLLSSPGYIPPSLSLSLPQFASLQKILHHFHSYYRLQSTTPGQTTGLNVHHNIHKMFEEYKGFGQKVKIYQAICGKCAKKGDRNQRKDGKEGRGSPFSEVCGFLARKIGRLRDNIQFKG